MKKIAILLVCFLLVIGIMPKSVSADVDSDMVLYFRAGRYRYYPERAQAKPGTVPSGTQRTGAADRAKGGI